MLQCPAYMTRAKDGSKDLRVLITGATSGLGREMGVQLGRRGCRVALTGRRKDKLAAAAAAAEEAGGEVLALRGSVTDPAAVREHYAEIKDAWGGLDWAVLNAGIADSRNAREFSAEHYHKTFAINVGGVVNWMEAVLPDMIAAGDGIIAGIASIAAYKGLPGSGAYCASKAALVTLLESTRLDLRGTGVDVVTVSPGFIKSEITDRNSPDQMPFLLETEDGVRRIIRGIERRKRLVHFPWQLSLPMVYLVPNLPDWLYERVISPLKRRKRKPYVDESELEKD